MAYSKRIPPIKIKLNVEKKILRISIPADNGTIVVNNPSDKLKNELVGLLVNCIVDSMVSYPTLWIVICSNLFTSCTTSNL